MSISLMYHFKKKAKVEKNETSKGICSPVSRIQCLFSELCRLFATPWTVDCQDPLSMGFSRQ